MKCTAGFDGSAKPNPGEMTIGGWLKDTNGNIIFSFQRDIGQGTNNIAEYSALIELLKEASMKRITEIEIIGDSALVVNQVNGTWKAKDINMKRYRNEVLDRLKLFSKWSLTHVLRKYNSEADSLTR